MRDKNRYLEVKKEVEKEGNLKHKSSKSLVKKRMIKSGSEKNIKRRKKII